MHINHCMSGIIACTWAIIVPIAHLRRSLSGILMKSCIMDLRHWLTLPICLSLWLPTAESFIGQVCSPPSIYPSVGYMTSRISIHCGYATRTGFNLSVAETEVKLRCGDRRVLPREAVIPSCRPFPRCRRRDGGPRRLGQSPTCPEPQQWGRMLARLRVIS